MTGRKGFEIVAAVVVVSVVAVIAIDRFIDGGGTFSSLSVFRRNEVSSGKAAATTPTVKTTVPSRRGTEKRPKGVAPADDPALGERALNPVEDPIRKSDERQVITPGMNRARVLQVFGEPTLRVTETHDRKVIERLIYVNRNRHTRTVAILENGTAVRSYTSAYFEGTAGKAER